MITIILIIQYPLIFEEMQNIKIHNKPKEMGLLVHPQNTDLPKKSNNTKENIQPKSVNKTKESVEFSRKDFAKKKGVLECDFSRISSSYVLEGNVLKKQEPYTKENKNLKINTKSQSQVQSNKQPEQNDDKQRKEFYKLQYLEKMGVLKPEEKQIMAKYRAKFPEESKKTDGKAIASSLNAEKLGNLTSSLYKVDKPLNFITPKSSGNNDNYYLTSQKGFGKNKGFYGSNYQLFHSYCI